MSNETDKKIQDIRDNPQIQAGIRELDNLGKTIGIWTAVKEKRFIPNLYFALSDDQKIFFWNNNSDSRNKEIGRVITAMTLRGKDGVIRAAKKIRDDQSLWQHGLTEEQKKIVQDIILFNNTAKSLGGQHWDKIRSIFNQSVLTGMSSEEMKKQIETESRKERMKNIHQLLLIVAIILIGIVALIAFFHS